MDNLANFQTEGTLVNDKLIAGEGLRIVRKGTLLSGQNQPRGAVLGRVTLGAASSAVKASGANAGGGTITLDVTTPILDKAIAGVYTVRCAQVAANLGLFAVTAPDGRALGVAQVGQTFANEIKFVLADVGTDFALGDGFDVTIAAGSGKLKLAVAAALDGSQKPECVLAEDRDASGGDKECVYYEKGDLAEAGLTFGAGHTADTVREALRQRGINLFKTIAA